MVTQCGLGFCVFHFEDLRIIYFLHYGSRANSPFSWNDKYSYLLCNVLQSATDTQLKY